MCNKIYTPPPSQTFRLRPRLICTTFHPHFLFYLSLLLHKFTLKVWCLELPFKQVILVFESFTLPVHSIPVKQFEYDFTISYKNTKSNKNKTGCRFRCLILFHDIWHKRAGDYRPLLTGVHGRPQQRRHKFVIGLLKRDYALFFSHILYMRYKRKTLSTFFKFKEIVCRCVFNVRYVLTVYY